MLISAGYEHHHLLRGIGRLLVEAGMGKALQHLGVGHMHRLPKLEVGRGGSEGGLLDAPAHHIFINWLGRVEMAHRTAVIQ